ncbi:MAG: outer membrane protein assembly factor BamB family protein [Planctomycetota bacterium]|jgi:outer membrane protein assembly factor BamB
MTGSTKPEPEKPDATKPDAGGPEAESARAELLRTALSAARATAIAAAVFTALVAAMLIANYVQGKRRDPLEPSAEYVKARKKILERTESEEGEKRKDDLRLSIRELDRQIRAEAFRRDEFRRLGGWLLLAGVVVLVTALQVAASLAKGAPHPEGEAEGADGALVTASRARWAVGVLGVALALGAVVIATTPVGAPPGPASPGRGDGDGKKPPGDGNGSAGAAVVMTDDYPTPEEFARNWPRFRGPRGDGVSAHGDIPVSWDEKTGKNILWRTPFEFDGASSPVVWGDRVFLTAGTAKRHLVYCLDAASGKLVWTTELEGVPDSPGKAPKLYEDIYHASPTPLTDGRRVYAIYANGDIGAFDYEGKQVWARALGLPDNSYGFAQSLAMWRGLVIIQFDQSGDEGPPSALHALDAATGRTVWVTERKIERSWASPIVVTVGDSKDAGKKGRDIIVTSSNPYVIAYEPEKGAELWRAEVMGDELAPSPIYAGGFVIAAMSGPGMVAIRPGGSGDVTKTHAVWVNENGDFPETPSPVSDGERVFTVTDGGFMTCVSMRDGATVWEHELDFDTYVSPSLVGGKVYVMGDRRERKGEQEKPVVRSVAFVVAAENAYRELGQGTLETEVCASPAFAPGRMYVRGKKALYCIGKK